MDVIETFVKYTEGIPSPEIFRLWAGISAVAASLERRVWVTTRAGDLFPNLYVMLVAPPAVGKGMSIDRVVQLWRDTKKLHVSPDSMTKASMLDALAASGRRIPIDNGARLVEYNAMAVGVEEFGVLVPAHDMEFLSFLIRIYNNPPNLNEVRRVSTSVDIINPQLNMLVGSQPGFLGHLLPEEAWSMGFMSRMVMIYATFGPEWDIFQIAEGEPAIKKELITKLTQLTNLYGQYPFTDGFKQMFNAWKKTSFAPEPIHSRLSHYKSRRLQLILKLSIVSCASRGGSDVDTVDLQRVQDWLLPAEELMPDIFREMGHKSDIQLIEAMHKAVWMTWSRDKKPVPEMLLYGFLSDKCPSERAPKIIDVACKSGWFENLKGAGMYVPKPRMPMGQ